MPVQSQKHSLSQGFKLSNLSSVGENTAYFTTPSLALATLPFTIPYGHGEGSLGLPGSEGLQVSLQSGPQGGREPWCRWAWVSARLCSGSALKLEEPFVEGSRPQASEAAGRPS